MGGHSRFQGNGIEGGDSWSALAGVPNIFIASRHAEDSRFSQTYSIITCDFDHRRWHHRNGILILLGDALSVVWGKGQVIRFWLRGVDAGGIPHTGNAVLGSGGQGYSTLVAYLVGQIEDDGVGVPHRIEVVVGVGLVGSHLGSLVDIG